jgi:hypothetical protein
MIIFFDKAVLPRTTTLDFIEHESFKIVTIYVYKTIAYSFVDLLNAVQPIRPTEYLQRSSLDDDLRPSLSCVDEDKLYFRIHKAVLFDELICLFEKLFVLRMQLNVPHRQILEDVVDCYFCTCVSRTLKVGNLKVKFAVT